MNMPHMCTTCGDSSGCEPHSTGQTMMLTSSSHQALGVAQQAIAYPQVHSAGGFECNFNASCKLSTVAKVGVAHGRIDKRK